MRVLRAKAVRKHLKFYKIVFGIVAPYHIILDGTFIYTAFKNKLDLRHRLESMLQERSLKLYILESNIQELRSIGEKGQDALNWALECCECINDSQYSSLEPIARLRKVLESAASASQGPKNRRRYFVASQDGEARGAARSLGGVPLLYFNKVTLVLEPPSEASKRYMSMVEDVKGAVGGQEGDLLKKISPHASDATATVAASPAAAPPREVSFVMRGKKRANNPNPLSSLPPKEDSAKQKKKATRKFRKFY